MEPVCKPSAIERAYDAGRGIVRLAPTWVPRLFSTPGRRLRLHPDDYFAFGKERGGIDERWIASPIRADNGPEAGVFEGLSLVLDPELRRIPFDEYVAHDGPRLLGSATWGAYGDLNAFAKFFDNEQALPFHLHHRPEHASPLGKHAKPEAYYYPPQLNNHLGTHPYSYLGLRPSVSKDDLRQALRRFAQGGDNRITDLSLGYRIHAGDGWDVPAGVLHAPGSALTYEPQAASDVLCMCESWSNNREVPGHLMWKDTPTGQEDNIDYLLELIDWEANTDPLFDTHRSQEPLETAKSRVSTEYSETWIAYKSTAFCAKELSIPPGGVVTIVDAAAYGAIVVQGHGRFGPHSAEAVGMLRFGELAADEFFVGIEAASAGVPIANLSATEPLVILKNFGPGNAENPAENATDLSAGHVPSSL